MLGGHDPGRWAAQGVCDGGEGEDKEVRLPALLHLHRVVLPCCPHHFPQQPPPFLHLSLALPLCRFTAPLTAPWPHGRMAACADWPSPPSSPTTTRLSLTPPSLSAAASLFCGTRAPPRTIPWTRATRRGSTSPASPMWWPELAAYATRIKCLEAGLRPGSAPACGGGVNSPTHSGEAPVRASQGRHAI